jgi:hypothetical protein
MLVLSVYVFVHMLVLLSVYVFDPCTDRRSYEAYFCTVWKV